MADSLCHIDYIGDYGARGRGRARPLAVEQQSPYQVALYLYRIIHAINLGQE
jgi:hypothetical protein